MHVYVSFGMLAFIEATIKKKKNKTEKKRKRRRTTTSSSLLPLADVIF